MTERVRGRVIKAFLPYLSDKFPISGVITTDPTPAICNINPFSFILFLFIIHPSTPIVGALSPHSHHRRKSYAATN